MAFIENKTKHCFYKYSCLDLVNLIQIILGYSNHFVGDRFSQLISLTMHLLGILDLCLPNTEPNKICLINTKLEKKCLSYTNTEKMIMPVTAESTFLMAGPYSGWLRRLDFNGNLIYFTYISSFIPMEP